MARMRGRTEYNMARLDLYSRADLVEATEPAIAAVAHRNLHEWRHAYEGLRSLPIKPADYADTPESITVGSYDGAAILNPGELPSEKNLHIVLREFCFSLALRRANTEEPRPAGRFPCLDAVDMSKELAELESWKYLTTYVLARGRMPAALAFMDGGQFVTTNWVTGSSMRHLLQIEVKDQLLSRMETQKAYPAKDVATVLQLCTTGLRGGLDLFLFEPGT